MIVCVLLLISQGGRIRTMADLKSLCEPEGEVHLDQLISICGMKKAEGKRFRRELMKLLGIDEQVRTKARNIFD